MISCPVGAIHMRTPDPRLMARVASAFPKEVRGQLPSAFTVIMVVFVFAPQVDAARIPGVMRMGHHSAVRLSV